MAELTLTIQEPALVLEPEICDLAKLQVRWTDSGGDGYDFLDDVIDYVPHGVALEIYDSSHDLDAHTPDLYYGVNIDLSVKSSRHTNQAEVVGLNQNHQLAVQDGNIAVQSDISSIGWGVSVDSAGHSIESTASVATGTTSSVNSTSHDHTSQQPAADINRGLSATGASHDVESDIVGLTVAALISTASSVHKIKSGRPILYKQAENVLGITNAEHSVNSFETLTVNTTPGLRNSDHAIESDVLELSTAAPAEVVLSPLSIEHALFATNRNLELEVLLGVTDVQAAHETEKVGITFNGQLGLVDSQHEAVSVPTNLDRLDTLVISDSTHGHETGLAFPTVTINLTAVNSNHDLFTTKTAVSTPESISPRSAWHVHFSRGDVKVNEEVLLVPIQPNHAIASGVFPLVGFFIIQSPEHSIGSAVAYVEFPVYPFKVFTASDKDYTYIARDMLKRAA